MKLSATTTNGTGEQHAMLGSSMREIGASLS